MSSNLENVATVREREREKERELYSKREEYSLLSNGIDLIKSRNLNKISFINNVKNER